MYKNKELRLEIAGAGLLLWQIADKLGIADTTFSRKLREELPEEEKTKIRSIIKELKAEEEHG